MKGKIIAIILLTAMLLSLFTGCDMGDGEIGNSNTEKCTHVDKDDDYFCDKCGNSFTDGDEIADSCNHRDKDDNNLCDYCNKLFSDGKESSGGNNNNNTSCNHNYYTNEEYIVITEPTCTEGGSMTVNEYCSNCGEFVRSSIRNTNPNGHMTESGKKVGICYTCGDIDPGVTVDPNKPYTVVEEGGYTFVFMGEYPQALKKNDVNIISDEANDKGYYLGSDGCYYARYVATHPYDNNYFQNGEPMTKGQEYYFKVMPIRWLVCSKANGKAMLVCDSVLDATEYQREIVRSDGGFYYIKDSDSIPANSYAASSLRDWLNEFFYNQAFTDNQKQIILTTTVPVSEELTNFNQNHISTEDKIFVPSYDEAVGANKKGYLCINGPQYTSDYLRAKGFGQKTAKENWYVSICWLRNPVIGWYSSGKDVYLYNQDEFSLTNPIPVDGPRAVIMAMYISFE